MTTPHPPGRSARDTLLEEIAETLNEIRCDLGSECERDKCDYSRRCWDNSSKAERLMVKVLAALRAAAPAPSPGEAAFAYAIGEGPHPDTLRAAPAQEPVASRAAGDAREG